MAVDITRLPTEEELIEQSVEVWKVEYEQRLREDVSEGRIELPAPEDRRKWPRLEFQRGSNVWLQTGRISVPIINISVQGIMFMSEQRHFPGEAVALNFADTISIEAIVLSCEMEESDAVFMECMYRTRTKYAPGLNGYRLYVVARDIYIHNLGRGISVSKEN